MAAASIVSRGATKRFLLKYPNHYHAHLRFFGPFTSISPSSSSDAATATNNNGFQQSDSSHLSTFPNARNPSCFMVRSYCSAPFPEKPKTETSKDLDSSPVDSKEADELAVRLRKASRELGWSLVALGASQFAHWTNQSINSSQGSETTVMGLLPGVVTFAFPCALAFLTWKVVIGLGEVDGSAASAQGKVRSWVILSKSCGQIESFLLRARVISLLCVVGVCFEPFATNIMNAVK